MTYKPIFETSDLPRLGPLSEDLRFDMKMQLNKQMREKPIEQQIEDLACDVAAFANTAGGVLLVGAHEHPKDSGILHAYVPITQPEANATGELLKKALGLCSPKPIAAATSIALPDGGGFAVAINCEPYAAPPIGVERSAPSGVTSGDPKWWAFPARRGRDNRNLRPEELATIMEPRLRRTILLLERIPLYPPENRRRATFYSRGGADRVTYDILSIDPESLSMHLLHTQEHHEIVIPLDTIQMIWRNVNNKMFCISLHGAISRIPVGLDFLP